MSSFGSISHYSFPILPPKTTILGQLMDSAPWNGVRFMLFLVKSSKCGGRISIYRATIIICPIAIAYSMGHINKMLSYRRETALQGALQFPPKVEDWNWETIFYGHYRSIFNHCDIIGLKICLIPWKKRKIRAITAFKVIQGHRGRYQSKARMRFPISD